MSEPTTGAGRRHLTTHDPAMFASFDIAWSGILAIEIEAVAAYRKELVEKVRGLGWIKDSDGWFCDECHMTSKANGHLSHCPYAAVLRLIELTEGE